MAAFSKFERALRTLARLHGIQTTYSDGIGIKRDVSSDALRVLLTGMELACSSEEEVRREIVRERTRSRTIFLDSVYVLWEDQRSGSWWVNLPIDDGRRDEVGLSWNMIDEAGKRESFELPGREFSVTGKQTVNGKTFLHVSVPYPEECRPGYYRLQVRTTGMPKSIVPRPTFFRVAPRLGGDGPIVWTSFIQ